MGDIFLREDVTNLLRGKYLLMLGCSNMRALYRELLWFLHRSSFVPESDLRIKLDFSYLGDRLLKQGELNRGRDYIEMREFKNEEFHVRYNFLTKLYTKEIENMMTDIKNNKCNPPDVILINSCIWDITRWGPDGVNMYKKNMHKVMSLFKSSLPSSTLVIFSTSLPVSQSCYGAFLVKQVEFMKHTLRFEIMEANLFAKQVVPTYGYNILDFHYYLRMQIHWRQPDGVHWKPIAMRHMSNLLLSHIALCWEMPLPGNFRDKTLNRLKSAIQHMREDSENALMGPPTFFKQLKTKIQRNIKDDMNAFHCPKFGEMRKVLCSNHRENVNFESIRDIDRYSPLYHDKENCERYQKHSFTRHSYTRHEIPYNDGHCSTSCSYASRDTYNPVRRYETNSSYNCRDYDENVRSDRGYNGMKYYDNHPEKGNIERFIERPISRHSSENHHMPLHDDRHLISQSYKSRCIQSPFRTKYSSRYTQRRMPY